MGAYAKVKVRSAESDREIAIQHADMSGRVPRPDFPGGALDERAEGDLVPMMLEQIAKHLLETGLVRRQREDLDDGAVRIDYLFPTSVERHPLSSSWSYRPDPAVS